MSNIILVSYNGGNCGEFLCTQISQDTNYYTAELEKVTNLNRWIYSNPFKYFNIEYESYLAEKNSARSKPIGYGNLNQERPIDLKCPWLESHTYISNHTADLIDNYYKEKNLLVPTHYWGPLADINLKRLRGVRFTFGSKLDVLFYTLLWVKTWTETFPTDNDFYRYELETCATMSNNIDMLKIVDKIIERGFVYSFERSAIRLGLYSSLEMIPRFFLEYHKHNAVRIQGWDHINVEDLMLDTASKIETWQQIFKMEKPLDVETIESYHQRNLDVIDGVFNKKYDTFKKDNWKATLTEWVKNNAPLCY